MKKVFWLLCSSLIAAALVLTSCGTTAPTAPTAPGAETGKPQYGGEFNLCMHQAMEGWDQAFTKGSFYQVSLVSETLLQGDWTKGAAGGYGTHETAWINTGLPLDMQGLMTGMLAESYEVVDPVTFVFKIRRGVHFHDRPPTNGREMTADDVVFSFKRLLESTGGRFV